MTKLLLTIHILLIGLNSFSQEDSISLIETNSSKRKYIAWISPSNATHVYGLMFNFWPQIDSDRYSSYPIIYGAEINLNPIGLLVPFPLAVMSLDPNAHKAPIEDVDSIDFNTFKKVHGFQIGLINMEPTIISGLDINASGSFESKINGVTISAVMNKQYIVNGLTFGIIGNHNTVCNGVQIGIINSCRQLKGLQFGLWNKNQNRSLPIINWNFK